MNRDSLPDRAESARLSARLEKLREEFDQRLAAKDLALADQERVIVRLEVEAARLRAALEALPERVRALGGFQKFREGEFWVSRDDVLRLLDEALNGGEAT